MSIINLTPLQLRQAADLKDQIAGLEKQLASILGGGAQPVPAPVQPAKPVGAKMGGMSAAAKANQSAKMKAYWAAKKAAKAKRAVVVKSVKKGGMSAAGKARIIAAQKLRWAKVHAAKAKPAAKVVAKAVVAAKPATKKGKISPEGMARIIAATKARWAKVRAAQAAKNK